MLKCPKYMINLHSRMHSYWAIYKSAVVTSALHFLKGAGEKATIELKLVHQRRTEKIAADSAFDSKTLRVITEAEGTINVAISKLSGL